VTTVRHFGSRFARGAVDFFVAAGARVVGEGGGTFLLTASLVMIRDNGAVGAAGIVLSW